VKVRRVGAGALSTAYSVGLEPMTAMSRMPAPPPTGTPPTAMPNVGPGVKSIVYSPETPPTLSSAYTVPLSGATSSPATTDVSAPKSPPAGVTAPRSGGGTPLAPPIRTNRSPDESTP
jgi:hypothetical protein